MGDNANNPIANSSQEKPLNLLVAGSFSITSKLNQLRYQLDYLEKVNLYSLNEIGQGLETDIDKVSSLIFNQAKKYETEISLSACNEGSLCLSMQINNQVKKRYMAFRMQTSSLTEECLIQDFILQLRNYLRPLKASTRLFCKAEQLNTKRYLAELIYTATQGIEISLDDVEYLMRAKQKTQPGILRCILISSILDQVFEQCSLLLQRKSISLLIEKVSLEGIYITVDVESLRLFLTKLLIIIATYCYGQKLLMNVAIDKQAKNLNIKIKFVTQGKRAKSKEALIAVNQILNADMDDYAKEESIALLDIMLCIGAIEKLNISVKPLTQSIEIIIPINSLPLSNLNA